MYVTQFWNSINLTIKDISSANNINSNLYCCVTLISQQNIFKSQDENIKNCKILLKDRENHVYENQGKGMEF